MIRRKRKFKLAKKYFWVSGTLSLNLCFKVFLCLISSGLWMWVRRMIISIYRYFWLWRKTGRFFMRKILSLSSNRRSSRLWIRQKYPYRRSTKFLEISQSEVELNKFSSKTYCSILNKKQVINESNAYKLCLECLIKPSASYTFLQLQNNFREVEKKCVKCLSNLMTFNILVFLDGFFIVYWSIFQCQCSGSKSQYLKLLKNNIPLSKKLFQMTWSH